jgi:hypothetical protein
MKPLLKSRRGLACLLAGVALLLPSCQDGHLNVFGYTSRPNYDLSIRTVHVPIFKNLTQGDFNRGLEFDLTRAVIREIEAKTPYKVVSDPCHADTELSGTIIGVTKQLININQENLVREAQTLMSAQVVWKDLRPGHVGEILSAPTRPGLPPIPALLPGDAPPIGALPPPPPTVVQSEAGFIPELGESITTAHQRNVDRLALQIVLMMEKPW